MEVYNAISKVQGELAKYGISKDQTNKMQGFKYRGIDDVYNSLAPILSENKLCILPRMVSKECVERQSIKGGALQYTTITVEFDIVSAVDGSKHTVSSYGEAMDSGDKSIGKAMSYAYKAMAFMTFSIPTEGDNDPDAQSHEVLPKTAQLQAVPQQLGACTKCSAPLALSKTGSKYCSKLCWKNEEIKQVEEIRVEDLPF